VCTRTNPARDHAAAASDHAAAGGRKRAPVGGRAWTLHKRLGIRPR
jgi:hypothetical protein